LGGGLQFNVTQDVTQIQMATISVICYKSKTLANGEHPLAVRITKDGKRSYKYLGVSVHPKHWDFDKNIPRKGCPNRDFIKKLILDTETEYQNLILEMRSKQKSFTPTSLISSANSIVPKTLDEMFWHIIDGLRSSNKIGNAKVYHDTYNVLLRYTKLAKLNLPISDVTVEWLNSLEKWLLKEDYKPISISTRFRTIRSVFNKAVEMNAVSKADYPFDNFKVSKFNVKTKKRAITKEDMKRIMNLNLDGESYLTQFSRDIFVFSYLHGGINFTDLANLKYENILENRIEYIRQKTGQDITIPLFDEGREIINRYKSVDPNSIYIFPILNERLHKSAQQKYNRIHKYTGHINKHLKTIGELAKIDMTLTTYVARHTYATVLKRSGVNTSIISESLGHSSEKITQIYLDSFENSQIDEAMKNLL